MYTGFACAEKWTFCINIVHVFFVVVVRGAVKAAGKSVTRGLNVESTVQDVWSSMQKSMYGINNVEMADSS